MDNLHERIKELEQAQEILLDDNKRLSQKVRELRRKTSFRVYEENLALAQEIERLKGEVPQ